MILEQRSVCGIDIFCGPWGGKKQLVSASVPEVRVSENFAELVKRDTFEKAYPRNSRFNKPKKCR